MRASESVCVGLWGETVSCVVDSREMSIELTDWLPFYDRFEKRSFLFVCPGICDEVVVGVLLADTVA